MQTENYNHIDSLIDQYLSGELDGESLANLKRWAEQSESNRSYIRNRLEIWFSSGASGGTASFDKNKAFELFKQRIDNREHRKMNRFSLKWFYRVAAVVLVLLLPLAGYWGGKEVLKRSFADMMVEAPMGSKTKLYLPDGTLVWLNAGSKILYSQGFGVNNRNLELEGEGYFEVSKNANLPFKIKTNEINLQVLGTKFNFKTYSDDNEIIINLIEGKVALENRLRPMPFVYLEPHERVILDKTTGVMRKSKTKAITSRAWTNGELFFDEEILVDIVKELERSYNVRISVADSLKRRRFYGSFIRETQRVEDVLKMMSSTGRMKYKYENGKYKLY